MKPEEILVRILLLTSSGNASGGGRQALYLASGLRDRGHEVSFFSPAGSMLRALAPELDWRDLPEKRGKWRKALEKAMPDKEPCIVHAFHNKAVKTLAWCGTLWRLLGRPVACVAHRGVIYPPNNFLPYIAPGIRVFAVNSLACLKTLPLLWRKAAGRVIYNCVPKAKVTPARSPDEIRAELGICREATVVGCVSNNSPTKGVEVLIRAYAKIAEPGMILCLVGLRSSKWDGLCAELGIADAVRIVPRTERVADYLQIFTLFVLPSLSESSPNTLLEAMCMGLPAVCSSAGGVPECISDPGYLAPPGDVAALAAAMASALCDRKKLAEAADRNLAFSELFSVEKKLDAMEAIYADLLSPYTENG